MLNTVLVTTRLCLLILCAGFAWMGFLGGIAAAQWYYATPDDPRLATMCQGPQNPGEGMFITMDQDRRYHCWDNMK